MKSFTVMLEVYNLSMVLHITPVATLALPFCFRIRTIAQGAMMINRLPDFSWNAEDIQMKYFTLETIQRLGAMIENKKPNLFSSEIL